MKKRLLGSLFSGLMLCFAAQSAVWAEATSIADTALQWEISENTLTISKVDSASAGSTAILDCNGTSGQPWETARAQIHNLIIEEGVTGIGKQAFFDCTSLESATIADTVTSIGEGAFRKTALTSITLPCSVKNDMTNANILPNENLTVTYTHEALDDVAEEPATCTTPAIVAHKKCSTCDQLFVTDETLESLGAETDDLEPYPVDDITYYEVEESDLETGSSLNYELELVSAKEATCKSKGVNEHYVCNTCGKKFKRSSEANTFLARGAQTSPKHQCLYNDVRYDCDETTDVEIDYGPHEYGELIRKVPAKCVDAGTEAHYECTVCGKKFVLAINDNGQETYKEVSDKDLLIPATGHSYSDWEITKVPTTTSEGEQTRYCSKCGVVEISALSKLAEASTSGLVSLTPTTYGYAVDTGDFISGEMFAYAYGLCACGMAFVSLRKKKSKV